jgi:serine/threonine protein kinase
MLHNGFDLIGTTLGRYRIVQRIGQGGYAVVYLAQQEDLSRRVAVKVLFPQAFRDSSTYQDAFARFKREAEVIAQANHENIITIHDYGEQDGFVYLVMPFFSQGSLGTLLDRRGKLPLNEALSYIDQAASALDYAHRHKVVHRDLKPGNFLLDVNRRLVLADFGIAHLTQDKSGIKLTRTDVSLGTPEYMAPEVISPDMLHGEEVDGRVDIYGLGILLFEMLSGDVPFKEENTYAVLLKHLSEPLPSLHHIDPTIPLAVDRVVQKATAKRREDRYASAGKFAHALCAAITTGNSFVNAPSSTGANPQHAPTLLARNNPLQPFYTAPTVYPAGAQTIEHTQQAVLPLPPAAVSPHQESWKKQLKVAHRWPMFVGALIIVSLAMGIWHALSGVPASTPIQAATTLQTAKAVVEQYYDDENNGKYPDAYNRLGSDYRKNHSYDCLLPSYKNTLSSSPTIGTAEALPDGTIKVPVTDQTQELDGPHMYKGYFIVKQEQGLWKLYPHFFQGQDTPC